MYDIVALGEVLIDFSPCGKDDNSFTKYVQNPGGAPLNVCGVFAKFGGQAAFIGKVGNDIFGKFLKEYLEEIKINTEGLIIDKEHHTSMAFVSLENNGEREFTFLRDSDINLAKEDVKVEMIKESKLFHFGSLSLTNEKSKEATLFALDVAKKQGIMISYDPNYREGLWESKEKFLETKQLLQDVDILKVSLEEAKILTGGLEVEDSARQLFKMVKKMVVITLGSKGSYFITNKYQGYIKGYPAKSIDTTGAGDIFYGTFLYQLINQNISFDDYKTLVRALEEASRVASLSTEKLGAIPSIPDFNG